MPDEVNTGAGCGLNEATKSAWINFCHACNAGSPETVCGFLKEQITDSTANYLVGQLCFGDLALDEMLCSVELFATYVMPPLQNDTSKSRRHHGAFGALGSPKTAIPAKPSTTVSSAGPRSLASSMTAACA
jgi:hypothetical protein